MIPAGAASFEMDFELEEQPTETYRMDREKSQIRGHTDGLEAMQQAIYKILNTERYQYILYSWDYGVELVDLFGKPVSYVCPELERRITEALLCDDRIQSIDNFEFDVLQKGIVHVSFTAHTSFGEVKAKKEVNI